MPYKIQLVVTLLFCTLIPFYSANAQSNVIPAFYSTADTSKGMFIDIENLNFFSNNEYNTNVLQGYTLMGTWANGSLKYRPSEIFSIEGGVQFRRFFGADSISQPSPFFLRVKFNPLPDLSIIFGELDHQHFWVMPQQMMDIERLFTHSREEGLQIKYDGESFFNGSTWINWERMIYEGSDFREQFTAGFNGNIILLNKNNYSLSIPLNYTAKHWGGEIDISPKLAATLSNKAIGLNLSKEINSTSINKLSFRFQYFTYNRSNHSDFTPFTNGSAFYPELSTTLKRSKISLAYWQSKSFASYHGDPIYANHLDGITYPKRSIIDGYYAWNYTWSEQLLFSFRTRFYYDIQHKNLELRAAIILHLKESFRIRKYD